MSEGTARTIFCWIQIVLPFRYSAIFVVRLRKFRCEGDCKAMEKNTQKAQLAELLTAIESVRQFTPNYTVSESPVNVEFTAGVKHSEGAIYLWIAGGAVAPESRFPPVGRFPPIAISGGGAVTMPSIRSYHRQQLASRGLPDTGDSEGFACAVFADHWLQKQISGERWPHTEQNEVTSKAPRPLQSRVRNKGRSQTSAVGSDPYNFVLQFDESEIEELVNRRLESVNEDDTMQAGRSIRAGNYTRENLRIILSWKLEGLWPNKHLSELDQNDDKRIADALQKALTAKSEKEAIEELDGLAGIGVPVASAILTAIYPERYTIIDINALAGLGVSNELQDRADYYVFYLQNCRDLAYKCRRSLRDIDHALWQCGEDIRQRRRQMRR
jgi:hypothetical protein